MPTRTGTSVKGLQFGAPMPLVTPRFLNVLMTPSPSYGRLDRLGTVLVCFPLNASQRPVATAYRLYGDGLVLGDDPLWPTVALEVWVNWFRSGVAWTVLTPG